MSEANPKIIHRIYFDNFKPFHDPFEHYLESWLREMPDYKVMKWNATNLDVEENEWTRIAYKAKAPVFLSEYFRWKVLSTYGGIYLDADCEVLNGRILHGLIEELYSSNEYETFFGVEERSNGHPTAQTVAAKKGSALVNFMKSLYETNLPELWDWRERRGLIGPQLMALYFLKRGVNVAEDGFFKNLDDPVIADNCKIYPQTYFSPKFSILGSVLDYQPDKTCVYHMFANSNVDFSDKKHHQEARQRALTFSEYSEALHRASQFPRRYDASWLLSVIGSHSDDGIISSTTDGVIVYGPYVTLPAGRYVARVHCKINQPTGMAELLVTAEKGTQTLARRRLIFPLDAKSTLDSPPFHISHTVNDIEVVLNIAGVSQISVQAVEFDIADSTGSAATPRNTLKILHRIYFGFDGKPDQFSAYLQTWQEQLPDYKIMHWNASNLPMDLNPYVRQLYEERDHAFLTDFFRWYVLREYGGTYLDADVEVVNGQIFNQLIEELELSHNHESFIGIDEKAGGWYTAHSMASKPQSDICRFMCELYENMGSFTAWRKKGFYFWAPQLVGLYFTNRGHHPAGMGTSPRLTEPVIVSGVKIYPQEWFSPLAPSSDSEAPFILNALTANTCLCHHFACSWHDSSSVYLKYSQTSGGQASAMVRHIAARMDAKRSFDSEKLFTLVGRKDGKAIRTEGRAGCLAYGPYVMLSAGRHKITYKLSEIQNLGSTMIDIVADHGNTTLLPLTPAFGLNDGNMTVDLESTEAQSEVEFRIHVNDTAEFVFNGISLERI
jgi:mannosyltransferase OCH1-like enzyme